MRYSYSVLSSNIRVNVDTNSRRVANFSRFHDFNREFIPSLEITDKTAKPDFTMEIEITRSAEQEINFYDRTLFVRLQRATLHLPDITFALLSVLSNLYIEKGEVLLHSAVVKFRDVGFLILGDVGDGKKELLWVVGKNGGTIVSCENTVIGKDPTGIATRATTNLLHLHTSIMSEVTQRTRHRNLGHKIYLDKFNLQQQGISMNNQPTTISAALFCKIIPRSAVFYQERLTYVDALLRIYRNSGAYSSGSGNILISASKPFPNLESEDIKTKRLALLTYTARNMPFFDIRGDPWEAIGFLEEVAKLVKK